MSESGTFQGLPRGLGGKESTRKCRSQRRCSFIPWVGKISRRSKWQPTLAFLLGNPMDRWAWRAAVHGVAKSQTRRSTPTTQVLLMLFNDYVSFSALLFLLPGVNLCFIRVTFLIYLPWGYPQSLPRFCKLLYSINTSGVLSMSSSSRGLSCRPQLTPVEIGGSLVPLPVWLFCCPVSGIWGLLSLPPPTGLCHHFAFQSPIMKGHLLGMLILEGLVSLHRAVELQLLRHYWLGYRLGLLCNWMVCPGNEQRSFCHFWDCIQVLHLGLLLTMRATPFLSRDSCPQ